MYIDHLYYIIKAMKEAGYLELCESNNGRDLYVLIEKKES